MRKWGIIITLFYALIVLVLLIPAMVLLANVYSPISQHFYNAVISEYEDWFPWVFFATVLSGQAILLFLSVDTSFKRRKPRAHIAVSCIAASMLFALLTCAVFYSLDAATKGAFLDRCLSSTTQSIGVCGILWLLWGFFFICILETPAT